MHNLKKNKKICMTSDVSDEDLRREYRKCYENSEVVDDRVVIFS